MDAIFWCSGKILLNRKVYLKNIDFSLCIVHNDNMGIQLISNCLDMLGKLGAQIILPTFSNGNESTWYAISPFIKHHQCIQSVLQKTWNKYYAHYIPNQWFCHYILFNKRGKRTLLWFVSKVALNETKLWSPIFLIISNCHGIWILRMNNVSSWFDRIKSKRICWK